MDLIAKIKLSRITFILVTIFFLVLGLNHLQGGLTLFSVYTIGLGILFISYCLDPAVFFNLDADAKSDIGIKFYTKEANTIRIISIIILVVGGLFQLLTK